MPMDYNSLGVIERVPSYSNEMMLERARIMNEVLSQTVPRKERNGRQYIVKQIPKYRNQEATIEKIRKSLEYYETLHKQEMSNTIELRDYQVDIVNRATEIINENRFVYLAMEVRTGKTLTSLSICDNLEDVNNVLFITKKKAIKTITEDSDKICPSYALFVINYESLHKLPDVKWDVIVIDEAHGMGAFPKPSGRALAVKSLIIKNNARVILLSGTPTPESYSQMFHQVYGITKNPFNAYSTFYKFAKDYVNVKQRKINGLMSKRLLRW